MIGDSDSARTFVKPADKCAVDALKKLYTGSPDGRIVAAYKARNGGVTFTNLSMLIESDAGLNAWW